MRLARTADPFIHTFQAGRYSMQGSAALTLPSAPAFVQTGARLQTDWTREPENRRTYNRVPFTLQHRGGTLTYRLHVH
jgi:hypothetical protein